MLCGEDDDGGGRLSTACSRCRSVWSLCLASDAGSSAYCSILAMIRSLSRSARRRISLIARIPHSICIPSYTPSIFSVREQPVKGEITSCHCVVDPEFRTGG